MHNIKKITIIIIYLLLLLLILLLFFIIIKINYYLNSFIYKCFYLKKTVRKANLTQRQTQA